MTQKLTAREAKSWKKSIKNLMPKKLYTNSRNAKTIKNKFFVVSMLSILSANCVELAD